MLNSFVCALVFAVFCVFPGHATTPTAQFLEKHPLGAIVATIKAQGEEGFDTERFFPFFLSVIEQENERCFGYHATTSAHMIFHQMVRCTLEELYGYRFPENFYFLRAPDPQGSSFNSVAEYIEQFSRKELSFKDKSRHVWGVNGICLIREEDFFGKCHSISMRFMMDFHFGFFALLTKGIFGGRVVHTWKSMYSAKSGMYAPNRKRSSFSFASLALGLWSFLSSLYISRRVSITSCTTSGF